LAGKFSKKEKAGEIAFWVLLKAIFHKSNWSSNYPYDRVSTGIRLMDRPRQVILFEYSREALD
jgi:hypothetical protein